ncbi:MAG: response regulator transcription factor [Candidatus Obscuribacterales bacterium]|nr:response regulator transcription factor [Candidatus Obscuribacterales bacterium]
MNRKAKPGTLILVPGNQVKMAKLLLVEDDPNLLEALQLTLELEKHVIDTASDGEEAEFKIKSFEYDLLIMDWQLPDKEGVDIVKAYRQRGGKTPILMLTGKSRAAEKGQGLDSGADDYLTKPFDDIELKARVRALLRRPAVICDNILSCRGISLNPSLHVVTKDDQVVQLMPKEYQLLEFLMRHPNQVFSQETLLNKVWPTDSEATVEALRTTLKRLRKKMDPEGQIIGTIHGVGLVLRTE